MSPTVYLHIGAPKTGTTYLQDRLGRNASALADHDVHFPSRSALVSPGLFHFRAALDLLGQDWGGAAGPRRGQLGRPRAPGAPQVRLGDHQPRDPRPRRPRRGRPRDGRTSAPTSTSSTPRATSGGRSRRRGRRASSRGGGGATRRSCAGWTAAGPGSPGPSTSPRCSAAGVPTCPPEHVHLVTVPPPGPQPARRRPLAPVLPRGRDRPGLGAGAEHPRQPVPRCGRGGRAAAPQQAARPDGPPRGGVRRADPLDARRGRAGPGQLGADHAAARRLRVGRPRPPGPGSSGSSSPGSTSSATSRSCGPQRPDPEASWRDPDQVSARKRVARGRSTRWRR